MLNPKNQAQKVRQFSYRSFLASSLLGIGFSLLTIFFPPQIRAAEEISFYYNPFGQFKIRVKDLEILANENKITDRLAFFTDRLTSTQLEQLKGLLSQKIEFNPIAIYKFANSPIGEVILTNIGTALKSDFDLNGFLALRAAILAAAFDEKGLTLINMLNKFPHKTIYMDTEVIISCIEDASKLLQETDSILTKIKQQSRLVVSDQNNQANFRIGKDLSNVGSFTWSKEEIAFRNPQRTKDSIFDLYLPQVASSNSQSLPLIIISHGLGSNRNTFAYLGEHLASQGFAVAIPEHIGTNSDQFQEILSGLAKPPMAANLINRPLDIKYLLDTLEQNLSLQKRLNLAQVGVIGQSLGAYTAFTVGGAELDFKELQENCVGSEHENVFFDLSALIQCRANQLPESDYQLQDQRIKAILAINPLGSKIFGQQSIAKIQVPTMILSGSNDFITPPLQEQIYPFAWLTSSKKYLILVENGTHFSFLAEDKGVLPIPDEFIGPKPVSAFPGLKSLSTAFFKTHIDGQPQYDAFLNSSYLNLFSNNQFQFSLIRTLTENQLKKWRSTINK